MTLSEIVQSQRRTIAPFKEGVRIVPDTNFAIEDSAAVERIRFRSEGLVLWLAIVICGLVPVGLATALFDLHNLAH